MKIAIVGTNFISDNFAEAARLVDGVEISAVYSRQYETGKCFANKHGIENVFTDYEKLLSDSSAEAVYVASPNICHAEQSVKAMQQGKHVLCEKLMGATLEDFLLMKRTADMTGRVLLEAMRPAHDPAYALLKEALPKIGMVRRASLEYCQYSSRYDRFKAGILTNAFNPKMKNSALADIGIYPLHVALSLFGMPKSVSGKSVFLENGFEGAGVLTLEYYNMLATVSYSKISDSVNPSVIEGECGSITVDKISAPTEIILKLRDNAPERLDFVSPKNNMIYEIAAFRDMCCKERAADYYLELTEQAQRIVGEIYRTVGISEHF